MAASISMVLVMVLNMRSNKIDGGGLRNSDFGANQEASNYSSKCKPWVAYSLPTPYTSTAHPLCPTARPTQSCKSCRKTSSSAVFTNIKRTLRYETQTSLPTLVDLWRHAL